MRYSTLLGLATSLTTAAAQYKGFNYGTTLTTGAPKTLADFTNEFNLAKNLVGASGFTSARLYTMIQAGTANSPVAAIQAAIDTQTSLLLGLWASAGQASFDNEVAALQSAIAQYGTPFTDLIVGISVGSEDLYRISPTGIINKSGAGADPDVLISYISQVRTAISGTAASAKSIGHVDTWTAFVNGTNAGVIAAVDWLGFDGYPYYQNTQANGIANAKALFDDSLAATQAASQGKPVWITETGWPVSGPQENDAVASLANAKTYWDEVGCPLFGNTNTWWYTLQDAEPDTPSPSFGLVPGGGDTPLFDLSCGASTGNNNSENTVSESSSAASSAAASVASSASSAAASSASASASSAPSAPVEGSPGTSSVPAQPADGASKASSAHSQPAGTGAPDASTRPITTVPALSGTAPANDGLTTVIVTLSTTYCPTAGVTSTATTTASVTHGSTSLLTTTKLASSSAAPTPSTTATTTTSVTHGSTSFLTTTKPASSTTSTSTAASSLATASPKSCPANLSGSFEYPHLIVPIDSAKPSTAYGTRHNGTVSASVSSLFNFDIPASYAGKSCSLVFLLPAKPDLKTSDYTLTGAGGLSVAKLAAPATEATTYADAPAKAAEVGRVEQIKAGGAWVVSSGACEAGSTVTYEVSATGGLGLEWFEDWNPSPVGLFVTIC